MLDFWKNWSVYKNVSFFQKKKCEIFCHRYNIHAGEISCVKSQIWHYSGTTSPIRPFWSQFEQNSPKWTRKCLWFNLLKNFLVSLSLDLNAKKVVKVTIKLLFKKKQIVGDDLDVAYVLDLLPEITTLPSFVARRNNFFKLSGDHTLVT